MDDSADNSGAGVGMFGLVWRLAGAAFFVAVIACGLLYGHFRSVMGRDVLDASQRKTVAIPQGADWSDTVGILRRAGLVDYPLYFEAWARWEGLPRQVKAGKYRLKGPLTVRQLANRLREGAPARDMRLTIPEGFSIFEIADRLDRRGMAGREEALRAMQSEELLERFGLEAESFEGYLFPDTYRFAEDATARDVVFRLHRRWREVWEAVESAHSASIGGLRERHGLERHEIVTLASIVEAETQVASERRLVARVILNRLEESMRLQMDPTCVYGPEVYHREPHPSLCKDPTNRYSTYVVDGLPPGPIGNPGRVSLEAAANPAEGEEAEEYLYFVARRDGSGRHVFSRNYREHRRAVERHLK